MTEEIHPCPFCNESEYLECNGHYVACEKCLATGPEYYEADRKLAIKAWNTRPKVIPRWLKDEINKLLNDGSLSHKESMMLEWVLSLEDDS